MNTGTKIFMIMMIVMISGFFSSPWNSLAAEEIEAAFTVAKLAVGTGMENRQLQGEAETFPVTTEKVYCLLEASAVVSDCEIAFAWIYNDKEVLSTALNLKQGARWRTWAHKTVTNKRGNWKVELKNSSGSVISSAVFKVE